MWPSGCKSLRPSTRFRTCTGIWSTPTKTRACRTNRLHLPQKTLSDTKKQVEIGSLAPIEVVRAQSTVAQDQQALTVALTNLQLEQLLMKNALSRTLRDPDAGRSGSDSDFDHGSSGAGTVQPIQDLVTKPCAIAPIWWSPASTQHHELSNKAVRNALLPTLDLYAYYGGAGVGGAQNPSNLCSNLDPSLQGFGCATTPTAPSATAAR